jgi:hypothetical protein
VCSEMMNARGCTSVTTRDHSGCVTATRDTHLLVQEVRGFVIQPDAVASATQPHSLQLSEESDGVVTQQLPRQALDSGQVLDGSPV